MIALDFCPCTHGSSTTGAVYEGNVLGLSKHRMARHRVGLTPQFAAEALLTATADYRCPAVLPLHLKIVMHLVQASLSPLKCFWKFQHQTCSNFLRQLPSLLAQSCLQLRDHCVHPLSGLDSSASSLLCFKQLALQQVSIPYDGQHLCAARNIFKALTYTRPW